ncbi:TrbC family F-type conjugative pilus assembly protein [Thalassotalea piscium]|uniref:Type-F conjugative transfer system pilin assembly protein TrbC n=1 Tax=Thalassotalea piscium TaxID=1230533 RepID=A0A7X0NGR9_9GAMM|nr:TrbC family F-type conjugative pilus assembly protein [Thalassotalea piscium]MBB6543068.1 type-F conjugative transfer system pilin assembly protein TrbC [Thalassotalea piscium]
MRLFNWMLLIVMLVLTNVGFAQVNERDINKIIESGKDNVLATEKRIKSEELIEAAKKNSYKLEQEQKDQIRKSPSLSIVDTTPATEDEQSDLWTALEATGKQLGQMTKRQKRYEGVDTFILISLSMPEDSLSRLFTEVAYQYPDGNVVLVFQGWQPPNFNQFISNVSKLYPDDKAPAVVVDPTVFKTLEVTEVPFFAIQTKDKGWKKVLGDVSLFRAKEEALSHYDKFTPIGKTFPIIEPNLLDYIYKKIEETDWNSQIEDATASIIDKKKAIVDLPNAHQSYSYMVDGTVTINEDIEFKGKRVATAGEQINPLTNIVFTKQYAVIDVNSKTQREIVRYWKKNHRNVKVISTTLPDFKTKYDLEEEFGQIDQLDPMVSQRFGLEKIPSLIVQKGDKLKVDVVQHDFEFKSIKGK